MKMTDWGTFYDEGIAYAERVFSSVNRGNLRPDVLHGIAAMANEKLLMALLMYHGRMPLGHTFFDLIDAASDIREMPLSLRVSLMRIDELLPLCSLDPAPVPDITKDDISMFVESTRRVRDYVDSVIGDEK